MKKNKPVKIKRYRRSFSGSGDRNNLLRRILLWVLILAVIFGLGWLVAKPGLDFASSLWYSYKNRDPGSSAVSQPGAGGASSSQPAEAQPTPTPTPQTTAGGGWASVALSAADTPEKAAALAQQLKAQGVENAVLTLKDDRGYLYSPSQVPLAETAVASTTVDAAAIAQAFRDAGLTPVAGLCAFKDSIAPYADRSMAVKYGSEGDITWLDSSAELGGKPWLNPNSAAAQQYIADLIAEVRDLGFEKVLLQNFQFPEGYSLEAASYGVLNGGKEQLLAELGKRYEAIDGVEVWFEFPSAAVSGENVTAYGASPASFGLQRVFVRLDAVAATNEAGENVSVPPAADAPALAALLEPLRAGGVTAFGLRAAAITDPAALAAANTAAKDTGFTSFFVLP